MKLCSSMTDCVLNFKVCSRGERREYGTVAWKTWLQSVVDMLLLYVGARYLGFAGQNVIRTSRWNEIHGRWNGLKPTESFTGRNLLRFDLSLPLKIRRMCLLWGNYLAKILQLAIWHRNSVVVPSMSSLVCVQCLLCINGSYDSSKLGCMPLCTF